MDNQSSLILPPYGYPGTLDTSTLKQLAAPAQPSSALAGLYKKWSRVMKNVACVEKNGRNDFHNFAYIRAEDLSAAVNAALATEGLSMLFSITSVEAPREVAVKGGPVIRVNADITIVDGETGASFTCKASGDGQDGADKALPKAITACLKYWLKTTLLVSDSEHEADAAHNGEAQTTKAKPRRPVSDDTKGERQNLLEEINRVLLEARFAGCPVDRLDKASEWLTKNGSVCAIAQLNETLAKVSAMIPR
jgi:hypothetical protein